jgi:hypothetical protein
MMQQREHDYDEILRRALHSAADLVEPSADGLERIRGRLTRPHPALMAWVIVGYSCAVRPVLGFLQPLAARLSSLQPLAAWLRATLGPVIERFRPARPDAAHPRRRLAWLRPAAAMGTAVFVVATGAFALRALPQVIAQSGAFIGTFHGVGPAGGAASARAYGHASPFANPSAPQGFSPGPQTGGGQRTSTCPPSKGSSTGPAPRSSPTTSSPTPSTSPTSTPSTSPSATATPTPTPSVTPTPIPTGSSSPNPAGATSSPAVPATGDTPIATPVPAAAVRAVVPAATRPSPAAATPCAGSPKATKSPAKPHISTAPGNGYPAISHAKAHQAA